MLHHPTPTPLCNPKMKSHPPTLTPTPTEAIWVREKRKAVCRKDMVIVLPDFLARTETMPTRAGR